MVILDVEMPEMDGLETLARAPQRLHPTLPVIMFSTLTERGAAATLDALALGASDYVTKPSRRRRAVEASHRASCASELIPRDQGAAARGCRQPQPTPAESRRRSAPTRVHGTAGHASSVVAIGVSTGGPNALAELLPALPADFPVPVLIVQHMPPLFTRLLAERLTRRCALAVARGGAGGEVLEPGTRLDRARATTTWRCERAGERPVLRDSTRSRRRTPAGRRSTCCSARWRRRYGAGALAVVLTGMGQDGLRGCEAIRERGGQVVAQDEATIGRLGHARVRARTRAWPTGSLPLDQLAARDRSPDHAGRVTRR